MVENFWVTCVQGACIGVTIYSWMFTLHPLGCICFCLAVLATLNSIMKENMMGNVLLGVFCACFMALIMMLVLMTVTLFINIK